ncbi:serine protease inhibitor 42Dd-like [Drosophila elegans]|uniref:serine protease inhibitor 42Dd-like n=1 Tax=Drosophila elegans TaxID=30023 RepID=UPI001BC84CF9|nr:serine protease inhibitor 42Dd-like [Drosophila elegans]
MKCLGLLFLAVSVAGRFTDDLYKLLGKENGDKNLICSPLSVEIAMSMVYMAAEGNTAAELRKVLKLPADKKEVSKKYKELLTGLEGREKVAILDLANRLYVNNKFQLVPEYNQVVRDSFKAEAEAISMANPGNAASIINKWVNDQTSGRIKNIISSTDINSDLVVVLLNAIYFKGQWKYNFDPKFTRKADFQVTKTNRLPVEMMSQTDSFRAANLKSLDAKVIELPYRNSSLSMLIFLPNKVDGLQELESKIAGFSGPLKELRVRLKLPKFKIEFSADLIKFLEKMGIREAFSNSAKLSGLVSKPAVKIGKAFQKAFIEVNEDGAEAAAVTMVQIVPVSAVPLPDMEFIADHPFAYVIRDENTIYFQGHFVKPGM